MNATHKNKGFTLIEVIVVIAVFLFVIGVAIGIFISIIQQQRSILAQQEILNQISYAQEHMSKALRMATRDFNEECLIGYKGYNYELTRQDADGFYTGIKFINQSDNNACTEFFLENGILKEVKNSSTSVAITSSKLKINKLQFAINGVVGSTFTITASAGGNTIQPKITILLGIEMQGNATGNTKYMQTTISQRNLNVE